ncbi:MAG: YqaA family protein [Rhodothalassiaceae bacterium]
MLKGLYFWTLEKARHRHAARWLAFLSFLESSVFPIPPDVMLVPMCLAAREKALRYGAICTVSSVLGAGFGYLIGALFWDAFGAPIIAFYGYEDAFAAFTARFEDYGALAVFLFGLTVLPFKVITLASGVAGLDPLVFFLAAAAARAPRFFIEAALLWRYGAPIAAFIERRLGILMSLFAIALIGGFLTIRFL